MIAHLNPSDLDARIGTAEWDGPPSRCEEAVAYLWWSEDLQMNIVVIVCPNCDVVEA